MKILVLNGPNLNLLGSRETEKYGEVSLKEIEQELKNKLNSNNQLTFKQTNYEGDLVNFIQQAKGDKIDFIIINPAAYTHTSIAIRDALLAVQIKFYEVHLSNIYSREDFRHKSYLSDIAQGVISGFGAFGYQMALEAIQNQENN